MCLMSFPASNRLSYSRSPFMGYRKARGDERKGLDSREAGFDAGKGRGSMAERHSGC
jgi:hypothetical protein